MKRPSLPIIAASHATALLVGALLALHPAGLMALLHRATGSGELSTQAPLAAVDPASSHPGPTSRAAAFREAWRQISLRPVARDQRLLSQREMLRHWAEFDLEDALHAAMAEGGSLWSLSYNSMQLAEAFTEAFTRHPAAAWHILAKGQLGFYQSGLEEYWVRSLLNQPETVTALFGEMTARQQLQATSTLTGNGANLTEEEDARLRTALLKSAVSAPQLADLLLASGSLEPSDSAAWLSLPDGPARTDGRLAWAAHLGSLAPAAFAAAWEIVPESDRAEVARLTAKTLTNASSPATPVILSALDHLIATGQWSALGSQAIAGAIQPATQDDPFSPAPQASPPEPDLLDWAMQLPDRPEAEDFLRNLLRNPAFFAAYSEGTISMDEFPAGSWQRDQVLLMLATAASDNGTGEAQAYASQITGPARQLRAQAAIRRAALARSMR